MKLSDALNNYYAFSASLSTVNRQLCFAGIAVVWIFVLEGDSGEKILPSGLIFPLGAFVVGLGFDLMHYVSASLIWGLYHRHKEKSGISAEADFGAPHYINWPAIGFYWLKVVSCLVGYVSLLKVIFG